MNKIDHFVFFHPNLEEGIQYIKNHLGIDAQIGGQHLGRGTWNALFSLGEDIYFEIISPDPKQMPFEGQRWMGVDHFEKPTMIRWAASVNNLADAVTQSEKQGIHFGEIQEGSRQLQNGETLRWQLTEPSRKEVVEPLPFLIEWTGAVHPAAGKKKAASLHKLILGSPDVTTLKNQLKWLQLPIEVVQRDTYSIEVSLDTSNGIKTI